VNEQAHASCASRRALPAREARALAAGESGSQTCGGCMCAAAQVSPADYVKPTLLANFRKAWEELDPSTEKEDEYGLGTREGLQVRPTASGREADAGAASHAVLTD
jgi:hypothetical protein